MHVEPGINRILSSGCEQCRKESLRNWVAFNDWLAILASRCTTVLTLKVYKCLANAKRPCDCRVLCLRLKSLLCVVRSLFQTWRHSAVVTKVVTVCAQCSKCQREEIQKARVNDGSNYDSPTVETLWAEIGRSRRFSKGVGHFERRFQREWGIAHQPLLVSENLSDWRFVWYQNIRSALFSFVTIHASDGQTDRQTDIRIDG